MHGKKSPIHFENFRPLGIGRITSLVTSTSADPGILLGSSKGLYHLQKPAGKIRRIRFHPVGWVYSGDDGLVCYEEVSGHGQLVFLDQYLSLKLEDRSLARIINPKAHVESGVIILDRGSLAWLDPLDGTRIDLAELPPARFISPFAPLNSGYVFISVEKAEHWPTWLYRLDLDRWRDGGAALIKLAITEDPVMAGLFIPLPGGDFLVIPQGEPIFQVYKIFDGPLPSLRTWTLVSIPGEVHPSGMLLVNDNLYIAAGDGILTFTVGDDILNGT